MSKLEFIVSFIVILGAIIAVSFLVPDSIDREQSFYRDIAISHCMVNGDWDNSQEHCRKLKEKIHE